MRVRLAAALITALLSVAFGASAAAQTAPPPTPVPPFGSPSPFPAELETPRNASRAPELTAASATLFDLETGQLLVARTPRARRPIASLTKIMTALLVLESTRPSERVTATERAASEGGAEVGLVPGERARVEDLLYALMLGSANDAAVALAEHLEGDVEAFVGRMNRRARRFGLEDTRFASPNGLDDSGYSTAADLVPLTVRAYGDPTFRRVVTTRFHRIPAPSGPDRRIQNRNALLWLYPGAVGIKTGYTFAAGYCLVAAARRDGLLLGVVVLGAPADAFSDAAALLNHGFERFERRTVLDEGEPLDPLDVDGVEVALEAGRAIELLLERGDAPDLAVRPLEGVELPVEAGERVAFVRASLDGTVLGRVPAVAAEDATVPAPAAETSWWDGIWDGVSGFVMDVVRALFG